MRLTRLHRSRLGVVAVSAAIAACGLALVPLPGGAVPTVGTPLPGAWELCILQGVNAPLTPANVTDLDEWQAAEGGSTNNTAAYNPFNTLRTTNVANTPLPETISANGFPAFSDWLSGCAATVATMLQPNMWSITAALRAGNVSPPAVFLAAVDQSQWCAPSANGTPCYADDIYGPNGTLPAGLVIDSSALSVYGNVQSDMKNYQQSETLWTDDQVALTAWDQQLATTESDLAVAQQNLGGATRELSRIAVDEYVSNGLYSAGSYVNPKVGGTPFGPKSANGVVAGEYDQIVSADVLDHYQAAGSAERAAAARRNEASHGVAQATATLASDDATLKKTIARLLGDVAAMQNGGACTTVAITSSVPLPAAPSTPSTQPPSASIATTTEPPNPTTTTTDPREPTTSTTSTTVPTSIVSSIDPTTTTSTSSTTTTSTSTTTTSTTTTSTTSTTTTVPTSAPSSTTTTTTTVPSPSSSTTPGTSPPTANAAGLSELQGCLSGFTPATSS